MKLMRSGMWMAGIVFLLTGAGFEITSAAERAATVSDEKAFLVKAAQGQTGEIALGKIATQRADSEKVKQFGRRMIEDHQKARQEISNLASNQGVELPLDLPAKDTEQAQRFSQLSGKDFDRAYMTYMLHDHMKDLTEFERSVQSLKNPQIKQWASSALPVLKEHLKIARTIAQGLGIGANEKP
jgi:putative membrane protein